MKKLVLEQNKGAASTLLYDVLKRTNSALGKTEEQFYCAIASSFMLSADNRSCCSSTYSTKKQMQQTVFI